MHAYSCDDTDIDEEIRNACRIHGVQSGTVLFVKSTTSRADKEEEDEQPRYLPTPSPSSVYSPTSVSDIPDTLAYPYDNDIDVYPATHALLIHDDISMASGSGRTSAAAIHTLPPRPESSAMDTASDHGLTNATSALVATGSSPPWDVIPSSRHLANRSPTPATHTFIDSLSRARSRILEHFSTGLTTIQAVRYSMCNKAGVHVRRARNLGLDRWLVAQESTESSNSLGDILTRQALFDLKMGGAGNPLLFAIKEREISQTINFFRQRRDPRLTQDLGLLQAILDFRLPIEISEHVIRLRGAGCLGGTWTVPGDCPMLPFSGRMY